MSYFHNSDSLAAMVFGSAMWTVNDDADAPCSAGGTSHTKRTAVYPLPAPAQDPITLLTGHGHQESTGSACTSGDFDETIVHTGD
jgi:serine/threonine-protein kinase